eukprot:Em0001g1509a
MAHVMLAAQQAHKMKQAVLEMDSSTEYMVFDFKQTFLAKGFREGGDSYYGKKGMLWWGAGVYVKPDTGQDDRSAESLEENHVEIYFTTEVLRLQQQLEMMNTGNVVLDDNGEEDSEYEKEDGVCEGEDNGEECGEECVEGVGGVEEDDGMKDDDKDDSEKEGEDDGEECAEGVGDVEEDDSMKDDDKEDSEKDGEDDGEECAEGVGDVEDDDGVHANQATDYEEEVSLHYFDCIVQGEQKADGNIVLSCLEAALHALKKRFPHVCKIIVQNDNAKNLAGRQTKLLLPHVCSAAGLKLMAYYHNEAQSGKDICDTHFSHQQTQVDAYLVKGSGGRKVSTPKQLAVALIDSSVSNATILLLKLDFKAPYRSAAIPSIPGISGFYAAQYVTTAEKQQMVRFYNFLGQKVPSVCILIPSCPAKSLITPMGKHICSGRMESRDALTNAMQHANKLLVSMDFTVDGAIAQASHIFETRYATFEPNFYAGWAHTQKGKIRAVYQSIGQKSKVQTSAGQKRGRHQEEGSTSASQKKPRIAYEEIDMEKELTQWKKYELEVYLSHHHLKKTGNKPELVSRVKEHMRAASN